MRLKDISLLLFGNERSVEHIKRQSIKKLREELCIDDYEKFFSKK
jgi:hypothetical protein